MRFPSMAASFRLPGCTTGNDAGVFRWRRTVGPGYALGVATVGDVMTRDVLRVDPSTTVAEAATMMGERRIGSALVMEDERLVGIFTERDIVRALGQHFDAAGHAVSEWMTRDPMTIGSDTSTQQALDTMLQRGFRHLPIVDGDRVAGIVSLRDLSRATSG
jgi:CBS domain-containing protein